MTRLHQSLWLAAVVLTSPVMAQTNAYDPIQARYLAANCANCHGTDGAAKDGMKALAGYGRQEFVETMNAFKSGKKPATLMHQLSKGYTDEQIATMAQFFSSQPKPSSK